MKNTNLIIIVIVAVVVAAVLMFFLTIWMGTQAYDKIDCWRCEELALIEATELRESIASVGKGDIGSKDSIVTEPGDCVKGIYLKHESDCATICPDHPNKCWVLLLETSCNGEDKTNKMCIDISGDADIQGPATFDSVTNLQVEKTGPTTIQLGIPR